MNSEKQIKIDYLEKVCAETRDLIGSLEEILAALLEWKGKKIDKRFCEQERFAYTVNFGDGMTPRTYHSVSIGGKRWEWSDDHTNQIYYGNHAHSNFEINGRDTLHVIDVVKTQLERHKNWVEGWENDLVNLLSLDEDQLKADLIEVCRKHGYPKIWSEILKSHEVSGADYKGRKED